MHVKETSVQSNPNIGLYVFATDTYAIIGPEAKELQEEIQQVLQVPTIIASVAGTSLAGVFLAGTSTQLLIPPILFDHEKKHLKEQLQDVELIEIDTIHTALGNNLVVNDHGIVAGVMFSKQELEQISTKASKPVVQTSIADIEVVGNAVVHTKKGGLIHRDATTSEMKQITKALNLPHILPGTVNLGQPYVRSAIIANTHGFLIGNASGGPEITNADEALGFIE